MFGRILIIRIGEMMFKKIVLSMILVGSLHADIVKIVQRYGTWIEERNGDTYKRYAVPNGTTVEVVDFKLIDNKRLKIKLLPSTTVGIINYTRFDHYLTNKEKKKLKKDLYIRLWATDLIMYGKEDDNLTIQTLSNYDMSLKDMLNKAKNLQDYSQLISKVKWIQKTIQSPYWRNSKKAKELVSFILSTAEEKQHELYEKLATEAFDSAKKLNTISSFQKFITNYSQSSLVENAQKDIYDIAYKEAQKYNTVKHYKDFIKTYPNAHQIPKSWESIYYLEYQQIKEIDNIAAYEWFIKTYPKAPQVKEAIANMHKLAFEKTEDIDTISAYNTFIISYPMAKEVSQANKLAKELERYKYTDTLPSWFRSIMPDFLADIFNGIFGIFSNDEKKSRALLIKAKQIERQGNEYYGDKQAGYVMITNRMYDLLQEEYNDTDATLRFLESEEFKDFVRTFKSVMRSMNDRLDDISRYSSKILEVSKQGFSEANADRDMSEYYAKEHREWEKNMHLRDKGYE